MGFTQEEYEEKLRNTNENGYYYNTSIGESNGVSSNAMDETALISPFDKASDSEREWLNKFVVNQPRETVTMFERLTKYFNGKHHVEEILFRETIKPRDLGKILSLFNREELIIVWC
ncbi:4784_t:CDS:2 [Scutellospora calospora]|uniref:4784_t:CDS:1 n=1 Tax=Scutellospora calospora TaxID=85575 RepID=A0ACA9MIP7_9GLOM|nr:4784_t:CDS:2 [Scutellospora calospora]